MITSLTPGERTPALYEIGVTENGNLKVRARRELLEYSASLPWEKIAAGTRFARIPGLGAFLPPGARNCGFGESFRSVGWERPDWHAWEASLPEPSLGRQDGELKLLELRATLGIFLPLVFTAALRDRVPSGATEDQVVAVEWLDASGDRASLAATVSDSVSRWLSIQPDESLQLEVSEAMRDAASRAIGETRRSAWSNGFWAHCRQPKWINLILGDRGGLDPSNYLNPKQLTGYPLAPHNVDTAAHQFALLFGLAKLHDLVRAWQRAGEPTDAASAP